MSSLFWPFFGVLLPLLRFRGKLSSGISSIRYHRVERRTMMLHKNYLSLTHWTTTQLTMQQGSERTRVKSRTSRLDSRALDRSKTKRLIPRAQLTASCYDLCAACSNVTSSRRRARVNIAMLYKHSTALLEELSQMTKDSIRLRAEYCTVGIIYSRNHGAPNSASFLPSL